MLNTETVFPSTLQLLKDLMALPELENFALAGGTNLSLQLGHRLSIDLDLFTTGDVNFDLIEATIYNRFKTTQTNAKNKIGIFMFIENVKVDIVTHLAPFIRPFIIHEGIRLASTDDIVGMKLNALAQRGLKKDFWDIAELFKIYTLEQMLDLYAEKYKNHELGFIVKSLTYLADAEKSDTPISLNGMNWEDVKIIISNKVDEFLSKIE